MRRENSPLPEFPRSAPAALVGAGAEEGSLPRHVFRKAHWASETRRFSPQMHAFKSFLVKPFNISEAPYTVSDTAVKNWNNAVFRLFCLLLPEEKLWMTCL